MGTVVMSKNGQDYFDVEDEEESINAALSKGYKPYIDVTNDGEKVFRIQADEPSILGAISKGYYQVEDFKKKHQASKTESFLRGAASGATFDTAPKITGAIESLVSDKPYAEARDESRKAYHKAYIDNPYSYVGGSMAGAAMLPIGAGARAASTVGAIGKGILTGAGTGALYGIGGNDSGEHLLNDAAFGATLGAIGGGVAGGLGRVFKLFTKGGRADLVAEASSFKRGAKEAGQESLPIIKQVQQVLGGAKETVAGGKAREAAQEFVAQNKAKYVNDLIKTGQLPTKEAKNVAKSLSGVQDDEYILARLLDGDPEMSNWVARQAGGNPVYEDLLRMGPGARSKLRAMDLNEEAKSLAPSAEAIQSAVAGEQSKRVGQLSQKAGQDFDQAINQAHIEDFFEGHAAAVKDLESLARIGGGPALKRVEHAGDLIASGQGGRSKWGLEPGKALEEADSITRFKRFQKAREIVDLGIDWEKIKAGLRDPTEAEKVLMDYRKSIDSLLKTIDAKGDADAAYRLGRDLDDMVFSKTEFKGGIDPYKIKRLLGNTDEANRFRDGLEKLRDWSENSADPKGRQTAEEFLGKFNKIFEKNEMRKALNDIQRSQGPSALAIQRLADTVGGGKGGAVEQAIKSPAGFMMDMETGANYVQGVLGKEFSSMTPREKSAFTKVLIERKRGRIMSDNETRNFYYDLLEK